MDYNGQTAVLSLIFVLVGIVFLVPVGTEKAMAIIHAAAKGLCDFPLHAGHLCQFTLMSKHLDPGAIWTSQPTTSGTVVTWSTRGACGSFNCHELGWVQYDVEGLGPVKLHFISNIKGITTCRLDLPPLAKNVHCKAGTGASANFDYSFDVPGRTVKGTASGFCGVPIHPCQFTLVSRQLPVGHWDGEPTQSGNPVTWMASTKPQTDLQGSVLYKVGGGEADLYFSNHKGGNNCVVNILSGKPYLNGSCRVVKGGGEAEITYNLRSPNE